MIVKWPGSSGGGAIPKARLTSATMLFPSGRLVAQRSQQRGLGKLLRRDRGHRMERRCLAVAVRDRSGLVQQQHVAIAGGLDRAPRRGDHVGAHHPAHPGDADRRQETADRRRNEADEQRNEHSNRHRRARLRDFDAVEREGQQRDGREQEDEGHRNQQDSERDFVRRLLPLRGFDHADHPVEEGFARIDPDAHDDPVRQDERAARHRVEVTAGGADHRCALAR